MVSSLSQIPLGQNLNMAGNTRYEMIANKLERSMDEVFACAKDLQEAMDQEHEKGNFNSPCDEWTYDIWVDSNDRR